ncbi:MAG: hypothetical protein ACOVQN_10045 [Exiguobacterium sp.]
MEKKSAIKIGRPDSLPGLSDDYKKLIEEQSKTKIRIELEDRENVYKQTKILEELLVNSKNAIEQRDALIHIMYQMINESDASDKVKSNNLLQIIGLVNTLSEGKENLIKILGLKDMM